MAGVTAIRVGGQLRRLPVVSWIRGGRDSAKAGAGCGMVGGACCAGGAVVKVLGLASAASVSAFIGIATPYLIGASFVMMLAWAGWLFRRTGYQARPFAGILVRHGLLMGGVYALVLGGTTLVAFAAGVSM